MKRIFSIALYSVIATLALIYGCTNFLTPNSGTTGSGTTGGGTGITGQAGTVQIISPTTNSTIGYTGENIEYKIIGGSSVQHIELYVNGNVQSIVFPSAGETVPKVNFNVDRSMIGTRFEYYLFYFDNNGGSAVSATEKNILISDVRIAPPPPFDVQLTPLTGGGAINVAWRDTSSFNVVFHVERSDVYPFHVSYISPALSAKTNNFTDSNGIVTGKTYYYKVISTNPATNNSSESEIVSTIGGSSSNFSLQPPSNLVVTAIKDTNGTVLAAKLDWKNNSTQYTYLVVERRMNAAYIPEKIASLTPNTTTFTDNTVQQWQGYSYRIKAFSPTDSAWTADIPLK